MELNQLAMALRAGSQGQAKMAGLNEDFSEAQRLRDTSNTKIDRFGNSSPLSVIADVMGRARGTDQLNELRPQREAARADIAENENAAGLFRAKQQMAAAAQAQDNFRTTTGLTQAAAQASQDQRDLVNTRYTDEQNQISTAPTEYIDNQGNRKMLSRTNSGEWKDGNRDTIPSIENWTEVPKASVTSDGSNYRDKGANARAETAINNLGAADRVIGLYNNLSPETISRISSRSNRIGKTAVEMLLPSGVAAYVKGEIEKDPQVKQYFTALSQMSAKERHAMFGGALTEFEGKSANDFVAFVVNMTPAEQQQRVQNSVANNMTALRTGDQIYGNGAENYMNAYNGMGFQNLETPTVAPQAGSVNAPAGGDNLAARIAAKKAEIAGMGEVD